MAERTTISQGLQIGVETTPGTPVAASKKLVSIGVESGVKIDPEVFTPISQKYASIVYPGKEWSEFKLSGAGSYSELLWILAGVISDPGSPTTVDTSARKWVFESSAVAADTVKTFTMEQGDSVRAHSWAYGLITDLEMKFDRQGVALSGGGIGQKISDGITMTATPTTPPTVQIFGNQLDVYYDTTSAGLGVTKLTRVLEVTISLSNRFAPVWVLNSANGSYVAHVESKPTAEIKLLVEADSGGMALLTDARASTTKFLRISGVSNELAGAATQMYQFYYDAAVKVKEASQFSDQDGLYAVEWTFEQVYDSTWGKTMSAQLWNKETAL